VCPYTTFIVLGGLNNKILQILHNLHVFLLLSFINFMIHFLFLFTQVSDIVISTQIT